MNKTSIAIGALALTLATAEPTEAAVTVTYESTLAYGYDVTNYFGLGSGGSLTNQAVKVVFTFDDQTPGIVINDIGNIDQISGYYGASPGSAVITINGKSLALSGDYYSTLGLTNSDTTSDRIFAEVADNQLIAEGFLYTDLTLDYRGQNLFTDPDRNISRVLTSGDSTFEFRSFIQAPGGAYRRDVYGYVDPRYSTSLLTISSSVVGLPGSAVPEPATWLMLLTGFAMIGGFARRSIKRRSLGIAG